MLENMFFPPIHPHSHLLNIIGGFHDVEFCSIEMLRYRNSDLNLTAVEATKILYFLFDVRWNGHVSLLAYSELNVETWPPGNAPVTLR